MKQPTPQPGKLADLVRTSRGDAGLSQRALAEAAGLGKSLIQRIEAGDYSSRMRPANIRAIAAALRFTAEQERAALLYSGNDPDRHATAPAIGRPTVSETELAAAVNKLSPAVREVLHAAITTIAAEQPPNSGRPTNGAAA